MRKLLLVLLMVLGACTRQGMFDKLASPQEQQAAIRVADQIRAGQLDQLVREADPQLQPQLPGFMAQVRPLISGIEGPFTIHGLNSVRLLNGPVSKTFTLQAGSGNRWALVTVVLDGGAGAEALRLNGVNVTPARVDPAAINNFRLDAQGAGGIVWIAIMLACVIVSLAGMILPWIGRRLTHRWAWTIGAFFSLFSFTLDWRTGHVLFAPLSLIFVGARTYRPGDYGPWFLSWGIPVVAILVIVRWIHRGRVTRETRTNQNLS